MSEYNLVLVSDAFFDMMTKTELDTFLEICANPVDGTVLVISLPSNTPKDKTLSAIVKAIGKKGDVCEFKKPNAMTVEKFIAKWANANGKLISRAAANKLVSLCGDDLTRLKNEVDKICSYSSGEEVSLEDIDKLYTLSNAYIDAYRVRVAAECGVMNSELAKDFGYGKRTFVLDRVKRSTNRVSTEALRKSLDLMMDADLKFKSVRLNDRLYLEQLIAQLLLTAREGRR